MTAYSLPGFNAHHRINALVLAGTRQGPKDRLAIHGGVSHKALLPIQGVPMVTRVVKTLASLPYIGTISICSEDPSLLQKAELEGYDFITAHSGPSASVLAGLHRLGTPLLVTTADHALLQADWVHNFITLQQKNPTDIAAAITSREHILKDLPFETQRTYLKLADGQFSGCNLFMLNTEKALSVVRFWQKLEAERKNPLKMAQLLGFRTLVLYLVKRLNRKAICQAIQRLTGATAQLTVLDTGFAAIDMDKPADLELADKIFKNNLLNPSLPA
ncbi:nucleotidyltransferase family protein [Entomobacter blattae]|uniref:MobA-like NTP transferase domain protein n=1 Tax=Entomobacter blattae TaxID=2762277 RepID=A0A7H1NPA5_9PROT|nr:nucleotidyltransferase family protein [Entomobacter blattae]QNT77615.1 MobA-like NTP transferase domain protein [Entomobacter blattae]